MPKNKKEKPIGKITHYFSKIKVAVVKFSDKVKLDDTVRVVGGEVDFNQKIKSMEVEGEKIKQAKKGDSVGLKVKEKVRQGYKVYRA